MATGGDVAGMVEVDLLDSTGTNASIAAGASSVWNANSAQIQALAQQHGFTVNQYASIQSGVAQQTCNTMSAVQAWIVGSSQFAAANPNAGDSALGFTDTSSNPAAATPNSPSTPTGAYVAAGLAVGVVGFLGWLAYVRFFR